MMFVLYTFFKLVLLIILKLFTVLSINSDVISSEIFSCCSQVHKYDQTIQKKIYHSIFTYEVIIVFCLFPLLQTFVYFFAHGVILADNVLSVVNTMLLVETTQIITESLDLVFLFEMFKVKRSDVHTILNKKELYFNITIFLSVNNIGVHNRLNVIHCMFVYYVSMILTQTTLVMLSLKKLSIRFELKYFKNILNFENNVWKANKILQIIILTKILLLGNAGFFEWAYILIIPIILLNQGDDGSEFDVCI
jgi:hypothetical protein